MTEVKYTTRSPWLGYSDDYDFWERTIGAISPTTAVEQANEEGLTLEGWAGDYLLGWPFDPLTEPEGHATYLRLVDILHRAATYEVEKLEERRDQLGLGYDDLGSADCVAVAFHPGRGFYVGDDGYGDWDATVKAALETLEGWAARIPEWREERAEDERIRQMEEAL